MKASRNISKSGSALLAAILVILALAGGGAYFWKVILNNRKAELEARKQQAKLQIKQEEAKARAAEESAAKANALTKEREMKRAAAEKDRQIALNEKKRLENEALNAKTAQLKEEKAKSEAAAKAAAAETAKHEAARKKAEADEKLLAQQNESKRLELARAEADRAKAEAQRAEKAIALQIAEAEAAKSDNERKAAEANAAAERDRKLRMYRRAETSRAEMLELQRAERMLAMEEAGFLPAEIDSAELETGETESAESNKIETVKVDWRSATADATPAQRQVNAAGEEAAAAVKRYAAKQLRQHVMAFSSMIRNAQTEDERAYYRKAMASVAPDYRQVYADLIGEAHRGGSESQARTLCGELAAAIPDWERAGALSELIERDSALYGSLLAGNVTQDEFVRAFRRAYERVRRQDNGAEKGAALTKTLQKYVPDFERHPEWR